MSIALQNRINLIIIGAASMLLLAGLLSCGGDGPTEPPKVTKPDITSFTGTPTDITPGDSVLFAYAAVRADSLKLFPTGQKLANAVSGSLYVKPTIVTTYTLRAYNSAGQDSAKVSITMTSAVPVITSFSVSEDTLVIADSVQVSWTCLRSDSVKLNGTLKLLPVAGGTVWFAPPASGLITAIAFNQFGQDTSNLTIRMEIPAQIQIMSPTVYFKGSMGSDIQSPEMRFRVVDQFVTPLFKVWMKFELLEGDGALSVDSAQIEASGNALLKYSFNGSLGFARIRAYAADLDTVVSVRASIIAPGIETQGQFIRRGDLVAIAVGFNPGPIADTPDPSFFLNYLDYEAQLGVVVIVEDTNHNSSSQGFEPVYGIILNTVYSGTTQSGWGIGALVTVLIGEYGTPSDIVFDATPPAAYRYEWAAQGLTAYTTTQALEADRTVFEVHLTEPASGIRLKRASEILK